MLVSRASCEVPSRVAPDLGLARPGPSAGPGRAESARLPTAIPPRCAARARAAAAREGPGRHRVFQIGESTPLTPERSVSENLHGRMPPGAAVRTLSADPGSNRTAAPVALFRRPDTQIVLLWLIRLRWLAVAGQLVAVGVTTTALRLDLPLPEILGCVAATAMTNLLLELRIRGGAEIPPIVVPGVLLFDVIVLTALLALSGGPQNPFCVLYLIHVTVAVVVLPLRWTWAIFGAAVALHGLLFWVHWPMVWRGTEPAWLLPAGAWLALLVAAGIIVYVTGELRRSLQASHEQVNALRSRISRNERLASLTTLAAGAAHELSTPLATIAVVSRELERRGEMQGLSGRSLEDTRLIRSEVNRCRRILDRMSFENTRGFDEQPSRFTAEQLVGALREELSPGDLARFRVSLGRDSGPIRAPRQALVQLLQILVQNALDASADVGEHVELAISRREGEPVFTVTDRGCGMSEGQLQRAGEPFVTTKSPQGGMGLGLYLARLIAEHLRGVLRLESAPGVGTVAKLVLPANVASGKETVEND